MLGVDIIASKLARLVRRQVKHELSARGKGNRDSNKTGAASKNLFDFDASISNIDTQQFQSLSSNAGTFTKQPEQDLLSAYEVVTKPPRLFLGKLDDLERLLCKSLKSQATVK